MTCGSSGTTTELVKIPLADSGPGRYCQGGLSDAVQPRAIVSLSLSPRPGRQAGRHSSPYRLTNIVGARHLRLSPVTPKERSRPSCIAGSPPPRCPHRVVSCPPRALFGSPMRAMTIDPRRILWYGGARCREWCAVYSAHGQEWRSKCDRPCLLRRDGPGWACW
jgi:hypothetical protein